MKRQEEYLITERNPYACLKPGCKKVICFSIDGLGYDVLDAGVNTMQGVLPSRRVLASICETIGLWKTGKADLDTDRQIEALNDVQEIIGRGKNYYVTGVRRIISGLHFLILLPRTHAVMCTSKREFGARGRSNWQELSRQIHRIMQIEPRIPNVFSLQISSYSNDSAATWTQQAIRAMKKKARIE